MARFRRVEILRLIVDFLAVSQGSSSNPDATRSPLVLHWRSLGDSLIVGLFLAGPTLFASFILRDQRERGWSVLLVVSLVGFLFGGMIAGRNRRRVEGALYQALAFAGFVSLAAVFADAIWHAVLTRGISVRTVGLWFGGPILAVIVASVGALYGRWRVRRMAARRRMRGPE